MENETKPPVLFNEFEAGEYLGGAGHPIGPATMQYWRIAGKGPAFIKVGRHVRYTQEALDAYLASRTFMSTSEPGSKQQAA